MNNAIRIIVLLSQMCLYGVLPFCGCTQRISGTEVGNPATVSGKVTDIRNDAVSNAVVFLVTPDYNPVIDTIGQLDTFPGPDGLTANDRMHNAAGDVQRVFTRTDTGGEFVFDDVTPQFYNLFVADSSIRRMGFRAGVTINASRVDLGECEIRSVGYAIVKVEDSVFSDRGYISLPGTPIKKAVDSAGEYAVPVFYDSITVNYYNDSGDSLASIISDQEVPAVESGDTIDLTGIETIIIPPVVVAIVGNDTLYSPVDYVDVHDTLIRIAALGASINKNSRIEYQFYETTRKKSSDWSTDSGYSLPVTAGSAYSLACRVRSGADTSIITGWTPALFIRIKHISDTVPIPAPSAPLPFDTFQINDTVSYGFIVRSSSVNDTFMLNYRLGWSDADTTYNYSGFSSWSQGQDSVCVIRFPETGLYEIRAQARSVADTSQLSPWSDSLLFTVSP